MTAARLAGGAAGGVAGGLVFGALMQMMGMMAMIGGMMGEPSAATGWLIHVGISVVIGLIYAVTLGGAAETLGRGAGLGLVYGAVWWVLGPLLIMPAMMGMPVFQLSQQSLMSLMGHLVYGIVLGLVFAGVRQNVERRQATASTTSPAS